MKYIFAVLILLITIGCGSYKGIFQLNNEIDISQRECLTNSNFENKNLGLVALMNIQKSYRKEYIGFIDSLLVHSTDTIIIRESFPFACIGCCADGVGVFSETSSRYYKWNFSKKTYEKVESDLIFSDDVLKLKAEIRKPSMKTWNSNPYYYGEKDENVLDGGHTFYSVIYPNKKVESMYIRAWRFLLD